MIEWNHWIKRRQLTSKTLNYCGLTLMLVKSFPLKLTSHMFNGRRGCRERGQAASQRILQSARLFSTLEDICLIQHQSFLSNAPRRNLLRLLLRPDISIHKNELKKRIILSHFLYLLNARLIMQLFKNFFTFCLKK